MSINNKVWAATRAAYANKFILEKIDNNEIEPAIKQLMNQYIANSGKPHSYEICKQAVVSIISHWKGLNYFDVMLQHS